MKKVVGTSLQRALRGATCVSALLVGVAASASDRSALPAPSQDPQVVTRGGPAGAVGNANEVNGIGQIVVRTGPDGATLNLCTGTLINPRTVLFAAHCVNALPAARYGQEVGAAPVAIGFAADNQAAVRQWLGLDGGRLGRTNAAGALLAVEQVWYDPRSLGPNSAGFLAGDIALATLDTPAFDIPTWAMLFSPLDGPTHATISGYGGVAPDPDSAISWRRRTAENMISVLGSLDDRDRHLFGTGNPLTNNLYMLSFTDPAPGYDPAAGKFDFGIFGDRALPGEGGSVGGDSGGPLIVDRKYDRPVVAGLLSGVARSFAGQQLQDFGTQSLYQPLHLYWDAIAANNSYIYAANRAGDGDWEDAAHWVRELDPNYLTDVGGALVNALPAAPAQGVAPGGAKFGQICFLASCTMLDGQAAAGPVEAGPGTLAFHPDNVTARPSENIKARYFDVTLNAPGTTALGGNVTIDRMTVSGRTRLDIRTGGGLRVLGEFNQVRGWTHVDGALTSGRDMLFASGMLSGSGIVRAPFVTVAGAVVAPGGTDRAGTLAVQGNLILSSASTLLIEATRGAADRLAVEGILSLSSNALDGGAILLSPLAGRPMPRHGDSLVVATATEGVQGRFGAVLHDFRGVLRPELRYDGGSVTADFRAASLAQFLKGRGATELAFAAALDALREPAQDRLGRLYGAIDLMDADTLGRSLQRVAPSAAISETIHFERQQSHMMLAPIADRLADLGSRATAGRLAIAGTPEALAGLSAARRPEQMFLANLGASSASAGKSPAREILPDHLSGFVAGGVVRRESISGEDRGSDAGQRAWHFGMGMEIAIADDLALGTAFGFSAGASAPGEAAAQVRAQASQMAVYGSYRYAGTGYVGAIMSAERSRNGIARQAPLGEFVAELQGTMRSQRHRAMLETGISFPVGAGLQLTPRARIGYEHYRADGFGETGGGIDLQISQLERERVEGRLGAKLAGAAALGGGWTVTPEFRLDWVRRFAGGGRPLEVRFASASDVPILLPLDADDASVTELGGRIGVARGALELSAAGTVTVGQLGLRDDRAAANLLVRF